MLALKKQTHMAGMTAMADPWSGAQERFNKFAIRDRDLQRKLADLSEHLAHDDKLAWALESGRVYCLRAQKYDMQLKRQLNKQWRSPPTEPMW